MAQNLYYLHTLPGLEQVAWDEISARLPGATFAGIKQVPKKNGILLFRAEDGPRRLLELRCAEDVFIVAARGFKVAAGPQGLRQIYSAVRFSKSARASTVAWEDVYGDIPRPASFRLVVRQTGSGDIMRREIGQSVSDAISDGWPGRWKRVEEDADVELWVNLLRDELLCGVRLSGAEMRHRDYQVEHTPASLRPSVAAALVRLTKPNASDVFLDPVVGSGTILLERAAAGPYSRLIGGDNSADVLDVARANARGVRQLELREWDARALPLADASVDKAALNLPFGRQISPGANLRELYRTVFAELVRVIRPGGTVATLAGDASAVDSALRSNPTLRLIRRITVNLLGYDATISVLARSKGLGSRD